MKRGRDENSSGPELPAGPHTKRPTLVRGETSNHHARGSAAPRRLTTDDAYSYLQAVKEIFKHEKGRYDEFLEVMKDFKAQRIDTVGVIEKVKKIFKDHHDLLLGFNTFLPRGYEIKPHVEEEIVKKPPVEFVHAISYVNKIKTRFQQDEHIYQSFLEILYMYRKGNKYIQDVYNEVAGLFKEHQDLLEEFTYFLPATSGVVQPTYRNFGASMTQRDDKANMSAAPKLFQPEKVVKREKFDNDCDRSFDKYPDQRNYNSVVKSDKDQGKRERDENEKDQAEYETEEEQDLHLLTHKRKFARKADDIGHKFSQVGQGGKPCVELADPQRMAFFEKLKTRFGNSVDKFLKLMNLYTMEVISREELQDMVKDSLGGSKDLLEGFNDFFSHCEGSGGLAATRISETLGDKMLVKPKVERDREKERVEKDVEKDRDTNNVDAKRDLKKERDQDKLASQAPGEPPVLKAAITPSKEKFLAKPISELDLSGCECCTPSYRLLPRSYPKPRTSLRSEWAHFVLNDDWVSRTSGSEDFSFKHMRKNQYEESICLCEDDRFELDMLLETTAVTVQRVQELLQRLKDINGTQDGHICMEDYLKAIHLRCIERIYGDHGLDVLDLLRKNVPVVALPVILGRLKQKQEDWIRCRAEMNKIWAEVYAKNYHKSLDHRSFYFKQQDKKSLSTKALLAEVNQISEKKQKDDDFILSIAAGKSQAYSSDLNFQYVDESIHDDLYRIVKYSADEVCSSKEQSHEVMKFWTGFLEPFLGVSPRPQGAHGAEATNVKLSEVKPNGSDDTAGKIGSFVFGLGNNPLLDGKRDSTGHNSYSTTILCVSEQVHSLDKHGQSSAEQIMSPQQTSRSSLSKASNSNFCHNRRSEKVVDIKLTGQEKDAEHAFSKVKRAAKWDAVCEVSLDVPTSGRVEREEGELSPSLELEERHANTSRMDQEPLFCKVITDNITGSRQDDDGDSDTKGEGKPNENAEVEGGERRQNSVDGEDSENDGESNEENSGTESQVADDSHEGREDGGVGEKNENESEAEGMAGIHEQGIAVPSWDMSLDSCIPLQVHGPSVDVAPASVESSTVFYGSDNFYVLFRLHQTMYERVLSAKINAKAAEQTRKSNEDGEASLDLFEKFMQVLFSLLDGSADNTKFEDDCRAIIGTQSYVLFTLDKLIYKLVKQLQAAASDEMVARFFALNLYENCRHSDSFLDAVYHANANVLCHHESLYRFEHMANSCQLSIQLMVDRSSEKFQFTANAMDQKFLNYLSLFLVSAAEQHKENGIFLSRNKNHFYGGDDCALYAKAMKNVFVANGLEYKISSNSFKVSYVLDTRDFFYRQHQKRKTNVIGRVQKFHRWLDSVC
ncbi:hypothetical protein L7F22_050054 [Adiantum nelumboides]|nr:hypothetical protein [Adiantum nelumboides]